MWACPTRSRVEPGSAHGIDRSSDPSPLFHVVAVATLAAVAAALGCSSGVALPPLLIGVATLLIWIYLGLRSIVHEVFPALTMSVLVFCFISMLSRFGFSDNSQ